MYRVFSYLILWSFLRLGIQGYFFGRINVSEVEALVGFGSSFAFCWLLFKVGKK